MEISEQFAREFLALSASAMTDEDLFAWLATVLIHRGIDYDYAEQLLYEGYKAVRGDEWADGVPNDVRLRNKLTPPINPGKR